MFVYDLEGVIKIISQLEDPSELKEVKFQHCNNYTMEEMVSEMITVAEKEKKLAVDTIRETIFGNYGIKSRVKSPEKIVFKMLLRNVSFNEIYDIIGVRLLTHTIDECYSLFEKIITQYPPCRKIEDFIAIPSNNGYQSIDTVIIVDSQPIQLQIRTHYMEKNNERGTAAHNDRDTKHIKILQENLINDPVKTKNHLRYITKKMMDYNRQDKHPKMRLTDHLTELSGYKFTVPGLETLRIDERIEQLLPLTKMRQEELAYRS